MVKHHVASGEYNLRRADCEAAVEALASRAPGIGSLRDVTSAQLTEHVPGLSPMLLRRARHVVTENQRVLDAAAALEAGDLRRLGSLMADSHGSPRDDFEVSCHELDVMVYVSAAAGGVERLAAVDA